jgi:alginate O-acetyltransferase complex protein AlgI
MLFNSIDFLIFFPLVTALFFMLPHRLRWLLLLLASCYFYMYFKPVYILILFLTIVVDYCAGILIHQAVDRKKRKRYLVLSIVVNVGILAIFKYYNFFNDNLSALLGSMGRHNPVPYLEILLPIGLSFHTFQAMSYTIEVYRGNQAPERHFGIYALYVMFYPQLVAGPIERPQNILHQFHEKKYFDYSRAVSGLRLMLWGFFKKMVIADNLSIVADNVFNNPAEQNSLTFFLGALFFTFQIYADFSGYSDIAIGSARVMGYDLMKNFNLPYIAQSIRDFWDRWHISLSTWFRDYLYIPLGGSRVGAARKRMNILAVFLVSGLWHGASWNFVVWGGLHGTYRITEDVAREKGWFHFSFLNVHIKRLLKTGLTFLLVLITWTFFRVHVSEAFYAIKVMTCGLGDLMAAKARGEALFSGLNSSQPELLGLLAGICFFYTADYLKETAWFRRQFHSSRFIRFCLYFLFVFLIVLFSVMDETQFIYFQF